MTTAFKDVKNNAKSSAVQNALNNTTASLSFNVRAGEGDNFPEVDNGFYITAWKKTVYSDPGDDPNMRIGLCTDRDGDGLTVTWGQFGTPITAMPGRPAVELLILDKHFLDVFNAINDLEENTQPLDENLSAIADLPSAVDTIPYFNAPGGAALAIFTGFARSLVASDDASEARVVLGAQPQTVRVVGTTNGGGDGVGNYVCDGTADNVQILQAVTDLIAAGGGTLLLKRGVYKYAAVVSIANASNIRIVGEFMGAVTFQPDTSITGLSAYRTGIFNFKSSTQDTENISIENIVFDANNFASLPCSTLTPGSAAYTMRNITYKNCVFKNSDANTPSVSIGAGAVTTFTGGPLGTIDGLNFENCEFKDSDLDGIVVDGSQVYNVSMRKCNFHDLGRSGVYLATDEIGELYNWTVKDCRFVNNKQGNYAGSQADFFDKNLNGIRNLEIENCYFGPTSLSTTDNFNLCLYNCEGLRVINNFFEGPATISGLNDNAAMAIGASKSGNYYRVDADRLATIEGNIFYKVRAAWDGDSMYLSRIVGNYFYENQYRPIVSGYSNHFATLIESNILYNNNTNPPDVADYQYAGMYINAGDGVMVRNNYVIDDRLLRDPTTGGTLSQNAGGALGARTYYVKITWVNDTGETLPSNETTLAVDANKLLRVTVPTTLGIGPPQGAKSVNVYVGTVSGAETLQGNIPMPTKDLIYWDEPTSGLVSGAALPGSNTTNNITRYGIVELNTNTDSPIPNVYENNIFTGMVNNGGVVFATGSDSIARNNIGMNPVCQYDQGNVTGAITFNRVNGSLITATLTGNITPTITNGSSKGDLLTLKLIQDGTGSRTVTWPSNFKKAGGSLTLSTAIAAVDTITMQWDGINWVEVSRALNVS